MSLETFVQRLNSGEWRLTGGREVSDSIPKDRKYLPETDAPAVVKVVTEVENLRIITQSKNGKVISFNLKIGDFTIRSVLEHKIEVRRYYMTKQMRKKSEGGGYTEVPTEGVQLHFTNFHIRSNKLME